MKNFTKYDVKNIVFQLCLNAYLSLFVKSLIADINIPSFILGNEFLSSFAFSMMMKYVIYAIVFTCNIWLSINLHFELMDVANAILILISLISVIGSYKCLKKHVCEIGGNKLYDCLINDVKKIPTMLYRHMVGFLLALNLNLLILEEQVQNRLSKKYH